MSSSKLTVAASIVVYLLAANCAQQPQSATDQVSSVPTPSPKTPLRDVVSVQAERVEIKAGGRAEARVKIAVADGYHINANPPTYDYLKATELEVSPAQGITTEAPVYPPPVKRKFGFAPDELAVYEGRENLIRLPLRAAQAASGDVALEAKLRAQACDDQTCYPPREIRFVIPVNVR
ncbi:MAG: hypothetical protein C4334_13615 [Pyrinomonas sp.]|uniref:protein-disulfide reductase DsbD domain-containing protein n=1 Tax=Pyrinomonas sp. TaxID=2080306 RepID=UPI003327F737